MKKKYNINIFGSTGNIGTKSLKILSKYFPLIEINLITANNNYKKLIKQCEVYKPKNVCIFDNSKIDLLKKNINSKLTKIIKYSEINDFLKLNQTNISILAISGYNALRYLPNILSNTEHLGVVNKECIVSGGHLFKKLNKKNKIFPLDSEHYSIGNILNKNNRKNYKKIYLTASGGPFLNKNFKNPTFKQVINHPKWKMGYKNSIDSATMANKCLEIIEAHYLFNIPFEKLDIIIHPEALVHSIIEYKNYDSIMNFFYHDMFIPIYNFLTFSSSSNNFGNINNKFNFLNNFNLSFYKPNRKKYPVFDIFNNLDKTNPIELIKFNCANEFAVNLFIKKKINFNNIHKIITDSLSLDFVMNTNDVRSIIKFQNEYIKKLESKFII